MADDVTLSGSGATPPANTKIVADEHATRGYMQVVKLAVSDDGSASLIPADSDGMHVKVTSFSAVVPVTDNSGSLSVDDNGGSLTIDGTVGISGVVAVNDNSSSLTVDDGGSSITIDGTVTVSDGGSSISVDDNAGSLTIDGTVTATQGGTWTVQPGNTANTTAWLVTGAGGTFPVTGPLTDAQLRASAVSVTVADNGASTFRHISAAGANQDSVNISTDAATLYGFACTNINAAVAYVKIYNNASPTSANIPVMTFLIPGSTAGGGMSPNFPVDGITFSTRLAARYTTAIADNSTAGVAANEVICNFFYRD